MSHFGFLPCSAGFDSQVSVASKVGNEARKATKEVSKLANISDVKEGSPKWKRMKRHEEKQKRIQVGPTTSNARVQCSVLSRSVSYVLLHLPPPLFLAFGFPGWAMVDQSRGTQAANDKIEAERKAKEKDIETSLAITRDTNIHLGSRTSRD